MSNQLLPEGTTMLDMSSPTFADEFMTAIGAAPGETVELVTPQFTREDGRVVSAPDKNIGWAELHKKSEEELLDLGLRPWDDNENGTLWLYPGEWYDSIPDGLPIVDIAGRKEFFKRGVTDDDIRFGCVAYGFVKEIKNV